MKKYGLGFTNEIFSPAKYIEDGQNIKEAQQSAKQDRDNYFKELKRIGYSVSRYTCYSVKCTTGDEVNYYGVSYNLPNDTEKAGQLAAKKIPFGPFHRFSIAPVHVRSGYRVMWFVWDSERTDEETGLPTVVAQCWDRRKAITSVTS